MHAAHVHRAHGSPLTFPTAEPRAYPAPRVQTWFDCAYALGGMSCDLLSGANMRAKLVPTSAVALAIYQHLLALTANNPDGVESPPSASHLQVSFS